MWEEKAESNQKTDTNTLFNNKQAYLFHCKHVLQQCLCKSPFLLKTPYNGISEVTHHQACAATKHVN